jgi:hypothetical protein
MEENVIWAGKAEFGVTERLKHPAIWLVFKLSRDN